MGLFFLVIPSIIKRVIPSITILIIFIFGGNRNMVEKFSRISLTMPNYLLEKLDDYSEWEGQSRSSIISLAVENFLNEKKFADIDNKTIHKITLRDKNSMGSGSIKEFEVGEIVRSNTGREFGVVESIYYDKETKNFEIDLTYPDNELSTKYPIGPITKFVMSSEHYDIAEYK